MKCEVCGRGVWLPFKCNYCGGSFCCEHRLPENHGCEERRRDPPFPDEIAIEPLLPEDLFAERDGKLLATLPRVLNPINEATLKFALADSLDRLGWRTYVEAEVAEFPARPDISALFTGWLAYWEIESWLCKALDERQIRKYKPLPNYLLKVSLATKEGKKGIYRQGGRHEYWVTVSPEEVRAEFERGLPEYSVERVGRYLCDPVKGLVMKLQEPIKLREYPQKGLVRRGKTYQHERLVRSVRRYLLQNGYLVAHEPSLSLEYIRPTHWIGGLVPVTLYDVRSIRPGEENLGRPDIVACEKELLVGNRLGGYALHELVGIDVKTELGKLCVRQFKNYVAGLPKVYVAVPADLEEEASPFVSAHSLKIGIMVIADGDVEIVQEAPRTYARAPLIPITTIEYRG